MLCKKENNKNNKGQDMKKITLLLAITCSGALNGMMEQPECRHNTMYYTNWYFYEEIITSSLKLNNNNIDDTIKIIKAASTLQGIQFDNLFNNLKDFTTLVRMLAKKSNRSVNIIAKKLGTPTAKNYIMVSQKLADAITMGNVKDVKGSINKGADVLFLVTNIAENQAMTMLELAVAICSEEQIEIVRILLDHGADPYATAGADYCSLGELIDYDELFNVYSVDASSSENYGLKQTIFPQFKTLLHDNICAKKARQLAELLEGDVSGE